MLSTATSHGTPTLSALAATIRPPRNDVGVNQRGVAGADADRVATADRGRDEFNIERAGGINRYILPGANVSAVRDDVVLNIGARLGVDYLNTGRRRDPGRAEADAGVGGNRQDVFG